MQFELHFEPERSLLLAKTTGKIDVGSDRKLIEALARSSKANPPEFLLIDHTESSTSALSSNDVRMIVDTFVNHAEVFARTKICLVLKRPTDYGIGRMWQAYAEIRTGHSIEIAGELKEAFAWLNAQVEAKQQSLLDKAS